MIDFRLCDLRGATLADFHDTAGSSVTLAVNAGRTASLVTSFDDPAAGLVHPLATVVKARWPQGALFSGVVLRPQYASSTRQVTIPAVDPSLRLQAFQVGARSDAAGLPGANNTSWGYTAIDQSEILARLVEHASPTTAEAAAGVPGHGIIRGSLPASVARDRLYEPGKQLWEACQQLAGVVDGVDFDLRALDETDGSLVALDTHYPQMGTDRSATVVFEYGWGRENCTECSIEGAGDIVRNRSIRVGQVNETTGAQLRADRDRTESQLAHGIYGEFVGEPDVVEQATLNEHAQAAVTNYGYPPYLVSVTPAQDDGTGYRVDGGVLVKLPVRYGIPPVLGPQGDYWLGDVVRVIPRDGAFRFDIKARVLAITLTNASTGAVVAGLRLAPLLGGGYRVRGVTPPSFVREFEAMRQSLRLATIVQ